MAIFGDPQNPIPKPFISRIVVINDLDVEILN